MTPTIMTEDFFAIDTNVLIYLEGNDSTKRQIAEILLSGNPLISPQVISEFINVTRRLRQAPKSTIISETVELFRHCPIAAIKHSTLDLSLNLIKRYDFQIFDSIIIATALESKCNILYSEDMHHGLTVENRLKIINPFV
jgi:predicted nucleic acid-binding protein